MTRPAAKTPGGSVSRNELLHRAPIAEPAAGLVEQIGVGRPANAHDHAVACHIDGGFEVRLPVGAEGAQAGPFDACLSRAGDGLVHRMARIHLDAGRRDTAADLAGLAAGTRVGNGLNHDARLVQVQGGRVAVGVGGQDNAAVAGLDGVKVDQALRGRGEHHAGQVVVGEDSGLLDAAGGHDQGTGPHLGHDRCVEQGNPLVGVPAPGLGRATHLEVAHRLRLRQQLAQLLQPARLLGVLVEEAAARLALLIDQEDTEALPSRRHGGRQARGTGANDEHVASSVSLGRCRRPVGGVDSTQARHLADVPLVKRKQPARRVECLVVEANGQKRAEPVDETQEVVGQAAERIDRAHIQSRPNGQHVAAEVGARAVLDHDIDVGVGQAVNAARPVVFETPAQKAPAAGPESAGKDVALEALAGLALKTELDGPGTVDPFPGARRQAVSHCGGLSHR